MGRLLPLLILACVAAHGPLLFNDGVFWDGWIYYVSSLEGSWQNIFEPFRDNGIPGQGLAVALGLALPYPEVSSKWIAFLSLLASGVMIWKVLVQEARYLGPIEGLVVSALFVAHPAFQFGVTLVGTGNFLCMVSFLIGSWLAFRADRKEARPRLWLLRGTALALFFYAFSFRPFVVFYGAFLVLRLWNARRDPKAALPSILARQADYLVLPILQHFWNEIYFPHRGLFSGVDGIKLSAIRGATLEQFIHESVVVLKNRLMFGPLRVFAIVPTGVALGGFLFFCSARRKHAPKISVEAWLRPWKNRLTGLVCALALLFLSALPFIVASKVPSWDGWEFRHLYLTPLPIALLLFWVGALVPKRFSKVGVFFWVACLFGFIVHNLDAYVKWQNRSIKDQAIVHHLRDLPSAREVSVFRIDDRLPTVVDRRYRFYEWSSIFRFAFGSGSRMGLYDEPVSIYRPYLSSIYHLEGFSASGCEAQLTIEDPRPGTSPWKKVFDYYASGVGLGGSRRDFLQDFLNITVQPLKGCGAMKPRR